MEPDNGILRRSARATQNTIGNLNGDENRVHEKNHEAKLGKVGTAGIAVSNTYLIIDFLRMRAVS